MQLPNDTPFLSFRDWLKTYPLVMIESPVECVDCSPWWTTSPVVQLSCLNCDGRRGRRIYEANKKYREQLGQDKRFSSLYGEAQDEEMQNL